MNIQLPPQVTTILDELEAAGFEAFAVGGCVRDHLLGKQPTDYDVTTAALPEQTMAVFRARRVIGTGLKHGTVTVLLDGMAVEVTTYRVDGSYSDHRRPDSVRFTRSLREDAARRDFTINAMAYSPRRGLMDFFGGEADLQAGVLRCVGAPERRFQEDALRLLRALRFSAVLGFSIEAGTAAALTAQRELLRLVSVERVAVELVKLLCGAEAARVLCDWVDVLGVALPELLPMKGFDQRNPHHSYDLLTHTARTVAQVPPVPVLRLAALLHDAGKPDCFSLDEQGIGHFYGHAGRSAELADTALRRLRFDNATREAVVRLVRAHGDQFEATEQGVTRALNRLTPELFLPLLQLLRADALAKGPDNRVRQAHYDALEALATQLIAARACLSLRDLAVNGGDLLALGAHQGKQVGELLHTLLNAVLNGSLPNERPALLTHAQALLAGPAQDDMM